jgi:hypothetical protein
LITKLSVKKKREKKAEHNVRVSAIPEGEKDGCKEFNIIFCFFL